MIKVTYYHGCSSGYPSKSHLEEEVEKALLYCIYRYQIAMNDMT